MTVEARIAAAIAELQGALYELQHEVPAWYHTAKGELGVKEIPGNEHNPKILEYLSTCHKNVGGNLASWGVGRDETPWCAAFVNWCLQRSGLSGTRSAAAKSYETWGRETQPRQGAIAVLTREGGGHVAFLARIDGNQVYLIGGNQGNAVSTKPYPAARVIGYRWPSEA